MTRRFATSLFCISAVWMVFPALARAQATSTAPASTVIETPKLNVPIPGLRFAQGIVVQPGETANIPFLAQYIAAAANYLLGIIVIAAAVMIVYGGFKYILASSVESVKGGKDVIKDAVIGLLLAFAVFTILRTLNPATLTLDAVRIPTIRPVPFARELIAAYAASNGQFIELTEDDKKSMPPPYAALTLKPASACGSKLITQDLRDAALKTQQATGVPAAVILAQYSAESGFGKACIGKEGQKFNCFGIKCVVNGKYEGREAPVSGGVQPTCPDTCSVANTLEPSKTVKGKLEPYWACFQSYASFADSLTAHTGVVKKQNWEQYNGSAQGFAHFVEHNRYAIPGYSSVLIQIMKDQCLL